MAFFPKQSAARIIKNQSVNWAGAGTAFSTNFGPETFQVRVISQVSGYVSLVPTTSDGTIPTTAGLTGTFIPAATNSGEYFACVPGQLLAFASTSTSTLPQPILNIAECC